MDTWPSAEQDGRRLRMLAATDGHAKNFSLRLLAQGRFRLHSTLRCPLCLARRRPGGQQLHPKKLKLAMPLRGKRKHYHLQEIERRHFNARRARPPDVFHHATTQVGSMY